mgnify:CR=1 FL=1
MKNLYDPFDIFSGDPRLKGPLRLGGQGSCRTVKQDREHRVPLVYLVILSHCSAGEAV